MNLTAFTIKPVAAALVVAGLLSACGGGSSDNSNKTASGGSGNTSGNTTSGNNTSTGNNQPTGNPTPTGGTPSASSPTIMSCPDGTGYQCSGATLIVAGEVAATDFGVRAYGHSTSDLAVPNPDVTNATGFQPDNSDGVSEVRIKRDSNGTISQVALVLDKLGLSWNGKEERPPIIETFNTTAGRVDLGANRALSFGALVPSSDTNWYDRYDWSTTTSGTQAHYANNRYFPRTGNPARCPNGATWCRSDGIETDGPQYTAGDWRNGGSQPDTVNALRFHEDGDVHAGDNPNGGWLPGGSGIGVPFPGSKGFRSYTGLSYQYANLGAWFSADTVWIAEWTGADGGKEHSTNRRGVVAFGALTNPALVPASGSATYSGAVYGRYVSGKDADPVAFNGTASISVNFATREAVITIQNTDGGTIPVGFKATATLGKAGDNLANYETGSVNNGKLSGTVSGRYFGPVASGKGPAETGGAFSLKNATTGEAVVGGFIARLQ